MRPYYEDYPKQWQASDLVSAMGRIDRSCTEISTFWKQGEEFVRSLREFISYGNTDEVLDFGGGLGRHTVALAPHVKRVHMIEVSQSMLILSQHETSMRGNVRTSLVTTPAILEHRDHYHWAMMRRVLHHLHPMDAQLVLEGISLGLKPGGLLYVDFFDFSSEMLDPEVELHTEASGPYRAFHWFILQP